MPMFPSGALSNGNTDTGVQTNHGPAEGSSVLASSDTNQTSSWASFLNPSYMIEGIQNARLSSALHMTSTFQALGSLKPSSSDFWEMAKGYEKTLQDYVPRLLGQAATRFKSTKFTDIASNMDHIVNATATFRDNIKGALEARHVTFDEFSHELEGVFMGVANRLKNIPGPSKAPGHAERAEMVDKVLDDTSVALTNLTTRYGVKEEVVQTYLLALKPHVQALTVVVGDINEQRPELFPALAFSIAALLIPESWILRPFLSVFGFGPAGPIKGSAAAWLQMRFWGAAVEAGSWFSCLQAAGMGVYPAWAGLVTKVPLLVGGLWSLIPSFRRG